MDLRNRFEVAIPVEDAWSVLTDVERVAPCLPGAQLNDVGGDQYRGIVKVKVGPVTTSYQIAAQFLELDEANHRAVMKAEGRETRGQGAASATIVSLLSPAAGGTSVEVRTDLEITGKVAQFGRSAIADVSEKLLEQFVHNLETTALAPAGSNGSAPAHRPTGAQTRSASPNPAASNPSARVSSPEPEPIDLIELAGRSLAKHLRPAVRIVGALVLIGFVIRAIRQRKR